MTQGVRQNILSDENFWLWEQAKQFNDLSCKRKGSTINYEEKKRKFAQRRKTKVLKKEDDQISIQSGKGIKSPQMVDREKKENWKEE